MGWVWDLLKGSATVGANIASGLVGGDSIYDTVTNAFNVALQPLNNLLTTLGNFFVGIWIGFVFIYLLLVILFFFLLVIGIFWLPIKLYPLYRDNKELIDKLIKLKPKY